MRALVTLIICATLGKIACAQTPSLDELEAQGARIGAIRIVNNDVFATDTPEENRALFRLANVLHIETRPTVLERQLLFKAGDALTARVIRESERLLRRNRYLFDAEIVPVAVHDNLVDLEVRTRDVWTFKPGIQFSRSGGSNSTGFELQESNLFGFGKEVTIAHKSNVDRTSNEFRYSDGLLFGSRVQLAVSYSDNSDGSRRSVNIEQPFYSLDSRWAAGMRALDWQRVDQRYVLGKVFDEFAHHQENHQVSGGLSRGLVDGWVQRYSVGATFAQDRFERTTSTLSAVDLPADRKFIYPFVGVTLFEDRYETRRNEDQIERTEDLYAGQYWQASAGVARADAGSSRDAIFLSFGGGNTFESLGRRHTFVVQGDATSRIEDGGIANGILTAASRYYWRIAPRQLFYASLSGSLTDALDPERQLTLGGDSGLRGYPLRYQEGSAAALLTLEHRVYTNYYLFRIFHLGGAVFFDAGRTWGRGAVGLDDTNLGVLKNVGLGLRFGSSRSAFGNVIHVDLAFPLDGDTSIDRVQFVVESKTSF